MRITFFGMTDPQLAVSVEPRTQNTHVEVPCTCAEGHDAVRLLCQYEDQWRHQVAQGHDATWLPNHGSCTVRQSNVTMEILPFIDDFHI